MSNGIKFENPRWFRENQAKLKKARQHLSRKTNEARDELDRDINAAVNILNAGLKDLYSLTSAELADYRRREAVRPEVEIPMASSMKRLVRSL